MTLGQYTAAEMDLPSIPLAPALERQHLSLGCVSSVHLLDHLLPEKTRTLGYQVGFLCPGLFQKIAGKMRGVDKRDG